MEVGRAHARATCGQGGHLRQCVCVCVMACLNDLITKQVISTL